MEPVATTKSFQTGSGTGAARGDGGMMRLVMVLVGIMIWLYAQITIRP